MAYKSALSPCSQSHNAFYVSLLCKRMGTNTLASTQLPSIVDDYTILPQSKAILNHRVIHKGKYRPNSES